MLQVAQANKPQGRHPDNIEASYTLVRNKSCYSCSAESSERSGTGTGVKLKASRYLSEAKPLVSCSAHLHGRLMEDDSHTLRASDNPCEALGAHSGALEDFLVCSDLFNLVLRLSKDMSAEACRRCGNRRNFIIIIFQCLNNRGAIKDCNRLTRSKKNPALL
ncbi:hypothetical protein RRG08_065363 [Elysia crispata]|uniref:Uncharacterized protein n=1 Tax=Elysia crispata TaxID=231223 RepID=A0AAE1AIH2_9GAST|nr:hypothetical protein RRG08_065363 [Elysia crispata]